MRQDTEVAHSHLPPACYLKAGFQTRARTPPQGVVAVLAVETALRSVARLAITIPKISSLSGWEHLADDAKGPALLPTLAAQDVVGPMRLDAAIAHMHWSLASALATASYRAQGHRGTIFSAVLAPVLLQGVVAVLAKNEPIPLIVPRRGHPTI